MKFSFLSLLASFALLDAPATAAPNYYLPLDSVGKMTCSADQEISSGTAHVIGDGRILTSAHIVHKADWCVFAGMGTKLVYVDNERNLAVFQAETGKRIPLPISCRGIEETFYLTAGYSEGYFVTQPLYGTNYSKDFRGDAEFPFTARELVIARGEVFVGMAGSPVIDLRGRVAGVVVADDASGILIRELEDSPICTNWGRAKMGLSPLELSPNRP